MTFFDIAFPYILTGGLVAAIGYPFMRMVIKYKEKIHKTQNNKKQTDNEMMNLINSAINNPNASLELVDKQIADLKLRGATQSELFGLEMKRKVIAFAAANPEISKTVLPGLVESGMKIVKRLPKILGGYI